MKDQIEPVIASFVETIRNLALQQVAATVQELATSSAPRPVVVSAPSAPKLTGKRRGRPPAAPARKAKHAAGSNGVNGHRGKRTNDDLDKLKSAFLSYIRDHVGSRIEHISKELGVTTKDLRLPVQKLLEDKEIYTTGNKRATAYYVQ